MLSTLIQVNNPCITMDFQQRFKQNVTSEKHTMQVAAVDQWVISTGCRGPPLSLWVCSIHTIFPEHVHFRQKIRLENSVKHPEKFKITESSDFQLLNYEKNPTHFL